MKYHIYSGLFIAGILCFSACSGNQFNQVVEVDLPPFEPQVVLHSQIEEDSNGVRVLLSNSKEILSSGFGFDTIVNANVQLTLDNGSPISIPYDVNTGSYFTSLTNGFLNNVSSVQLTAETPGREKIVAQTVVPVVVSIDSATYSFESVTELGSNYKYDGVNVFFVDPANQKNYYAVRILGLTEDDTDPTIRYFDNIFSDSYDFKVGIAGETLIDGSAIYFTDGLFDGEKVNLEFFSYNLLDFYDGIYVDLISISKDEYNYRQSLSQYYNAEGNPFAEPVVVFSNVQNGLGLLSVSKKRRKAARFKE